MTMLKIGDVINHKRLGIMILVEELSTEDESRIHGQPLFKMKRLLGNSKNEWILYKKSLQIKKHFSTPEVSLASDSDILTETLSYFSNINISKELSLSVAFGIEFEEKPFYYLDNSSSDGLALSHEDLQKLKKTLNELF